MSLKNINNEEYLNKLAKDNIFEYKNELYSNENRKKIRDFLSNLYLSLNKKEELLFIEKIEININSNLVLEKELYYKPDNYYVPRHDNLILISEIIKKINNSEFSSNILLQDFKPECIIHVKQKLDSLINVYKLSFIEYLDYFKLLLKNNTNNKNTKIKSDISTNKRNSNLINNFEFINISEEKLLSPSLEEGKTTLIYMWSCHSVLSAKHLKYLFEMYEKNQNSWESYLRVILVNIDTTNHIEDAYKFLYKNFNSSKININNVEINNSSKNYVNNKTLNNPSIKSNYSNFIKKYFQLYYLPYDSSNNHPIIKTIDKHGYPMCVIINSELIVDRICSLFELNLLTLVEETKYKKAALINCNFSNIINFREEDKLNLDIIIKELPKKLEEFKTNNMFQVPHLLNINFVVKNTYSPLNYLTNVNKNNASNVNNITTISNDSNNLKSKKNSFAFNSIKQKLNARNIIANPNNYINNNNNIDNNIYSNSNLSNINNILVNDKSNLGINPLRHNQSNYTKHTTQNQFYINNSDANNIKILSDITPKFIEVELDYMCHSIDDNSVLDLFKGLNSVYNLFIKKNLILTKEAKYNIMCSKCNCELILKIGLNSNEYFNKNINNNSCVLKSDNNNYSMLNMDLKHRCKTDIYPKNRQDLAYNITNKNIKIINSNSIIDINTNSNNELKQSNFDMNNASYINTNNKEFIQNNLDDNFKNSFNKGLYNDKNCNSMLKINSKNNNIIHNVNNINDIDNEYIEEEEDLSSTENDKNYYYKNQYYCIFCDKSYCENCANEVTDIYNKPYKVHNHFLLLLTDKNKGFAELILESNFLNKYGDEYKYFKSNNISKITEGSNKHFYSKCDSCKISPIMHIRWKCCNCIFRNVCDNCFSFLSSNNDNTDLSYEVRHNLKSLNCDLDTHVFMKIIYDGYYY